MKNSLTVIFIKSHPIFADKWKDKLEMFADVSPFLQITHPAGCFNQFIRYFGEKVFVLWKLILLQKRILFFSPPPAGISSYRGIQMHVHLLCMLQYGSYIVSFHDTGTASSNLVNSKYSRGDKACCEETSKKLHH